MNGETVDREVAEFVQAEVKAAQTICSRVGLDSISSDDVVAVAQVINDLQERNAELEAWAKRAYAYIHMVEYEWTDNPDRELLDAAPESIKEPGDL